MQSPCPPFYYNMSESSCISTPTTPHTHTHTYTQISISPSLLILRSIHCTLPSLAPAFHPRPHTINNKPVIVIVIVIKPNPFYSIFRMRKSFVVNLFFFFVLFLLVFVFLKDLFGSFRCWPCPLPFLSSFQKGKVK